MFPFEQNSISSIMLDPWFVTGFSDGEAALTYSRSGKGVNLYFSIRLREDDTGIILKIRDFFGVGNIYSGKGSPPKKYSGHTGLSVYYRVSKAIDLIKIVQHFDKYPLQSKKIIPYEIWREMVILKQKVRNPDFEGLTALARQLSCVNSKSQIFSRMLV